MSNPRCRRIAWFFALVLLAELALLCCACGHLSSHHCADSHTCALCRCLRQGLRFGLCLIPVCLAALLSVGLSGPFRSRRAAAVPATPVSRRVRLND